MVGKRAFIGVKQRWKEKSCGAAIWCSRLCFLVSAGLFFICCIRLIDRFFLANNFGKVFSQFSSSASPTATQDGCSWLSTHIAPLYNRFLAWCETYMQESATSAIFLAVGLVNYSYSYIAASREKSLYGIRLYEVMHNLFPWHGVAYGLHGAWVIAGLYCSASGAPLMATVCMVGVFFIFISTGVMMYLFNSGNHRKQMMVEYYLCRFGESTAFWSRRKQRATHWTSAMAYMFLSADYLRQYYLATQKVPELVAQTMWKRFVYRSTKAGLPMALLREELTEEKVTQRASEGTATSRTQLGDLYATARQIIQFRRAWQRMLAGLPPDKQADFIRQVLQATAKSSPCEADPDKFCRNSCQGNLSSSFFELLMSALISFLLDQERPAQTVRQYWNGWEHCVGCIFQVSATHLGETEDNDDTREYCSLVQQMFILAMAVLMLECSVLEKSTLTGGNNLWRQIQGLSTKLNVPLCRASKYFLLGRCITLSSSDDFFSAPQGLAAEQTYDFLSRILASMESK